MDPAERESRLRAVAISRMSRELDNRFFSQSEAPRDILLKSFEDIKRFGLYRQDNLDLLHQAEELLKTADNFEVLQRVHMLLKALLINYEGN